MHAQARRPVMIMGGYRRDPMNVFRSKLRELFTLPTFNYPSYAQEERISPMYRKSIKFHLMDASLDALAWAISLPGRVWPFGRQVMQPEPQFITLPPRSVTVPHVERSPLAAAVPVWKPELDLAPFALAEPASVVAPQPVAVLKPVTVSVAVASAPAAKTQAAAKPITLFIAVAAIGGAAALTMYLLSKPKQPAAIRPAPRLAAVPMLQAA